MSFQFEIIPNMHVAQYVYSKFVEKLPEKLGSLTRIWFVDGKWNMNHYDKLNLRTN